MSGQTAGGLPYPTGTDKVRDGDNAMKALADALQLRGHGMRLLVQQLVSDPVNAGYTWFRMTLGGTPWTAAPIVLVQCLPAGGGSYLYNFHADDIRVTGEVGGYIRENGNVVTGTGATVTGRVWAFGPI
jgi:hypothetical protein